MVMLMRDGPNRHIELSTIHGKTHPKIDPNAVYLGFAYSFNYYFLKMLVYFYNLLKIYLRTHPGTELLTPKIRKIGNHIEVERGNRKIRFFK